MYSQQKHIIKMEKTFILAFAILTSAVVQAQSSFTTIQHNKRMQPALRLELPSSVKDVEATILEKLKQVGYKPETEGHLFWKDNKIDGFYVFNNTQVPSISSQTLDLYFKVAQKTSEEINNSTLYFLVSRGNENFASPEKDSALWNNAKVFFDGFIGNTMAYSLEQEIKRQEEFVEDAQKKLATLRKDEKDIEDKMKKLDSDLKSNQSGQIDQQVDIEKKEKALGDLKLKRKE